MSNSTDDTARNPARTNNGFMPNATTAKPINPGGQISGGHPALRNVPQGDVTRATEIARQIQQSPGNDRPGREIPMDRRR
jgi:hypothetical protein